MTLVSEHIEPDTRERFSWRRSVYSAKSAIKRPTVADIAKGAADEPGERLSLFRFRRRRATRAGAPPMGGGSKRGRCQAPVPVRRLPACASLTSHPIA